MADTTREPEKRDPAARQPNGRFGPGNRANPGGRPKLLVEIERMLDAEHRTPENMREVFTRLRELAMEDMITAHTDEKGVEHITRRPPSPEFMKLYLDRTLGPVKPIELDLTDAPPEALRWLAEYESN